MTLTEYDKQLIEYYHKFLDKFIFKGQIQVKQKVTFKTEVKRAGELKEDYLEMFRGFVSDGLDRKTALEVCSPILDYWLKQDSLGLDRNQGVI